MTFLYTLEIRDGLRSLTEPQDLLTLVTPRGGKQGSLEELNLFSRWPFPYKRPWILCCGLKKLKEVPNEWFSDQYEDSVFEERLNGLSTTCDWACYSYFTSYDTNYVILQSDRGVQLPSAFEHYESSAILRNFTFGHYEVEGELPRQLAQHENDMPYLLTFAEKGSGDRYQDSLKRISSIETWPAPGGQFQLSTIDDWSLYEELWRGCSEDDSVVSAVYSSDLNIPELKHKTAGSGWTEPDCLKFSSWAYQLVYGGGADEHHAWFRTERQSTLQWVQDNWRSLGLKLLSRF